MSSTSKSYLLCGGSLTRSHPAASPSYPIHTSLRLSGNWTAEVGWRVVTEINTWWRPCHCSAAPTPNQSHTRTYTHTDTLTLKHTRDIDCCIFYLLLAAIRENNPVVHCKVMAGLLCGTKRKKQGNLTLLLNSEELGNGNGEAWPVTLV